VNNLNNNILIVYLINSQVGSYYRTENIKVK